jgi:hypothetical protein
VVSFRSLDEDVEVWSGPDLELVQDVYCENLKVLMK